jgi:hypothetical protein
MVQRGGCGTRDMVSQTEITQRIASWICGASQIPKTIYSSMIIAVTIAPGLIIVSLSKQRRVLHDLLLLHPAFWYLGTT